MRCVRATSPDGDPWTIRVVWLPRWRALVGRFGGCRRDRLRDSDGPDVTRLGDAADVVSQSGGGGSGSRLSELLDDVAAGVLILVLIFIAVGLVWWIALPLLLLVIDVLVLTFLFLAGVVARVLFRRPWTVEAKSDTDVVEVPVVGWFAALRLRDRMADAVKHGRLPLRAEQFLPR